MDMSDKDTSYDKTSHKTIYTAIDKLLFDFLKSKNKNKIFSKASNKNGIEFIDYVLEELQIDYQISKEDIKRIPKNAPFVVISNYSLGGLEIFILIKVFVEIHPNFKVIVNKYMNEIKPLRSNTQMLSSQMRRKMTARYISLLERFIQNKTSEGAFAILPASLVKSYQTSIISNFDKAWDISIVRALQNAQIPILPVYFKASNPWLAQLLGAIPKIFNTVRQNTNPLSNIKRGKITMRIGNTIPVQKQNEYRSSYLFRRYLNSRIYALGTGIDEKKIRLIAPKFKQKKAEDIIDKVPTELIIEELKEASGQYKLFKSGDFEVFCVPSLEIPNTLREIGRLREITFREVGEGSNKSIDLDDYDFYYNQLIVWDSVNHKISGAYRAGMGKEIIEKFGIDGFYISSLFNIRKSATDILSQSIELGRSFVVKEYQRKPLSLFLLWKGIVYFLLKNKEYRYLIGPASISNDFSEISKNVIVSFFKKHHYDNDVAKLFIPRKEFRIKKIKNIDHEILFNSEGNLSNIDKFVSEIENQQGIPVLLKKYIKLNAKIIGFNVDPSFNNCLDGLIFLDLFDVPMKTLNSLSKELKDDSIMTRFTNELYN